MAALKPVGVNTTLSTSGTASTDAYAVIEYSILDADVSDNTGTMVETA